MQENKQKVQENYKEEFQVPRDLVKYVIGQKGYNIQEARKIPDIVSIHVTEKKEDQRNRSTILAKVKRKLDDHFTVSVLLLTRAVGPVLILVFFLCIFPSLSLTSRMLKSPKKLAVCSNSCSSTCPSLSAQLGCSLVCFLGVFLLLFLLSFVLLSSHTFVPCSLLVFILFR